MFRSPGDRLLLGSLRCVSVLAGAVVLLIVVFLLIESWPALRSVGPMRFLTDPSWHPAASDGGGGRFNLIPMLIGTLASTLGAVMLATPVGIASALFCRFYAPRRIATGYRRLLELLTGTPSVVFGLWGLQVLAPLICQWRPPGQSLLAGVLILTMMILPTVALLSESSLNSVPRAYLRGAAALGLSRWAAIRSVVLPAARGGIITAVLLATGRAIGETMAVLMVAGNVVRVPQSVFDPVRTLTANIALELGYAMDIHRSALFVSGLVLMVILTALIGVTEWIGGDRLDA